MTSAHGFDVLPIVVDAPGGDWEPITKGVDEADFIAALLADHFLDVTTVRGAGPVPYRFNDQIGAWLLPDPPAPRSSILLWIGHGQTGDDPELITTSAHDGTIPPEKLAKWIVEEGHYRNEEWSDGTNPGDRWAVVVVLACGAARFVELVEAELARRGAQPHRLLLVGVGEPGVISQRATDLRELRDALSDVLAEYGDNDETVDVDDLGRRLGRRFGPDRAFVLAVQFYDGAPLRRRSRVLSSGVTAALDAYDELRSLVDRLPPDVRSHFARRGLGSESNELSWNFVGRTDERLEILRWLRRAETGMLIVTGAPGTGKSALLGHIVMLRDRELTDLLISTGHLEAEIKEDRPAEDAFDDVLSLTGTTVSDVVKRLATAAGLPPPATAVTVAEQIDRLLASLADRPRPFTILADALDEAQQPEAIAVLFRRVASITQCRVVVGTRASTGDDPDQLSSDRPTGDLLNALGAPSPATRTMVVPRGGALIENYVRRRLTAARGLGQLTLADDVIDRTAATVAAGDRPFLYARLAVHEILQRPDLLSDAASDSMLTGTHRSLFALALDRLRADDPACAALLEALGQVPGRGIPRGTGTWTTIAHALSGFTVTEEDVDRLLNSATPYVMTDTEDGSGVYRLAHRTFQEFIATSPEAPLKRAAAATALLDALETGRIAVDRHLRRHLVRYIAVNSPEHWRRLESLPDILDQLHPESVAATVTEAIHHGNQLPPGLACYADVWPQMTQAPIADRAFYRQLGIAGRTGGIISSAPGRPGPLPAVCGPWRLQAAMLRHRSHHATLVGHPREISAIAPVPLRHGGGLLVTGDTKGMVRIWDPATGLEAADPLIHGDKGRTTGLSAAILPDGSTLLVTGHGSGTLRLWHGATGKPFDPSELPHPIGLSCVTLAVMGDGSPILVTGDGEGLLRRFDPLTGDELGQPTKAHEPVPAAVPGGVVALLTTTCADGRVLVVSGGADGTVSVWNPTTGRRIARRRLPGQTRVYEVIDLSGTGSPGTVAISGGRKVYRWTVDPAVDRNRLLGMALDRIPLATRRSFGPALLLASSWSGPTGPEAVLGISDNGALQFHRLEGSARVGALPLNGPVERATPLAGRAGHKGQFATGDRTGAVRLWSTSAIDGRKQDWDPSAGALHWTKDGDQQAVLLTGRFDGSLRRLEQDGTMLGFGDHGGRVRMLDSVPTMAIDGMKPSDTRALFSAGNGPIRRWAFPSGSPLSSMKPPFDGETLGVCTYQLANGTWRVASGGQDSAIHLWDPITGQRIGRALTGHQGWVWRIVPIPSPSRETLLVSTDAKGELLVWDGADGSTIGRPVQAGRSGLDRSTLPADGTDTSPVTRHVQGSPDTDLKLSTWVRALTAVTGLLPVSCVATGDAAGHIQIWDLMTGSQIGGPFTAPGHAGVEALATIQRPNPTDPPLLISGHSNGAVCLWQPSDGRLLHTIFLDSTVRVIAVRGTDIAVGLDQGVVRLSIDPDSARNPVEVDTYDQID